MEPINFFLTVEKLFLIARGLDDILMDSYALLRHGSSTEKGRILDAVVAGVSELRKGLEDMVMAENRCIPEE